MIGLATKAAVAHPAAWNAAATLGTSGEMEEPSLPMRPCSGGSLPVSKDAVEGQVHEDVARQRSKSIPSSARRSMVGVAAPLAP